MAQPFDNSFGSFFDEGLRMDVDFVRENRIAAVELIYSEKLPNRPIASVGKKDRYRFNREGQLIQRIQVNNYTDTIRSGWTYSGKDLISSSRQDALGLYEVEIEHLAEGERRVKQSRSGRTISRESIQDHRASDTLLISRYENGDGVHYKTERLYTRKDGRLAQKVTEFTFGSRRDVDKFSYHNNGWIATKEQQKGNKSVVKKYTYSDIGELLTVETIKSGKSVEMMELLYDDGLPEAFIIKELDTNHLKIAKFHYTFR